MKRLLLIVILLCISVFLSAAGSWSSSDDEPLSETGNSASMDVSLKLKEKEQVTIGFSSEAVSSLSTDVIGQNTAVLTVADGVGTLSGNDERYIFWQIASPNALEISLEWPEKMNGSDPDNSLGWTITTELPSNQQNDMPVTNGTVIEAGDLSGAIVLDRSGNFNYGTVGSQKLIIKTDPLSTAVVDDYRGTLTLTVKAKGEGGN